MEYENLQVTSKVFLLLQDIVTTKMEGEPKVKNVVSLAEKILPGTAPQGKEIIMRETDALKDDWEAFVNALQKVADGIHFLNVIYDVQCYVIVFSNIIGVY